MTFNFDRYDENWANFNLYPTNIYSYFYAGWEFPPDFDNFIIGDWIYNDKNKAFGYTTGNYDSSKNAYEFISNWYINDKITNRGVIFSNKLGNISFYKGSAVPSTTTVKTSLDKLLDNNHNIYLNNVASASVINRCVELGVTIPYEYKIEVLQLQFRLENRNEQIAKALGTGNYQTYKSPQNNELVKLYNSLVKVGLIISTTTGIIIAIVVVALAATVGWLLYQKLYPESKVDLKYSEDLMRKLKQYLPKDVYDQLMKENKENEKRFNKAIQDQKGLGTIKTLGIAAALFFGIPYLLKQFND